MNPASSKSVTLMELLIALALSSVIILGLTSIYLFSRFHLVTSDRRAQAQNEASYVISHMGKEIAKAIGNEKIDGVNSVVSTNDIDGYKAIEVYIDANRNGLRETTAGTDHWIAYRFDGSAHQMQYCVQCLVGGSSCTSCSWENLSKKIIGFDRSYTSGNNYVEITLTACWDPGEAAFKCGSIDNPTVTLRNRIVMPAVSTN